MKLEIKYPKKRSKERNFNKDWDVRVLYKGEFPTIKEIENNYVTLPITEFWDQIGLTEETFETWILDKVFKLMNQDNTNPMTRPEMQEWIRKNTTHTSMSVGDVIKVDNKYYVCKDIGWKEIKDEETKETQLNYIIRDWTDTIGLDRKIGDITREEITQLVNKLLEA